MLTRFTSPPIGKSTFHDLVNKGKIIPVKGLRGFYQLNQSLQRLGLPSVAELPRDEEELDHTTLSLLALHLWMDWTWRQGVDG